MQQPSGKVSHTPELSRARAARVTDAFSGKRLIVLGDLMLDEFIWGRVRRISPEAPVPVVEVERHTLTLGGAGNVAANLVALGATAALIGVVGSDRDGDRLRETCLSLGLSRDGLVSDGLRPTTVKTRIIAHNQQVVRADRESRSAVSAQVEDKLIGLFKQQLENADAVVISDYGKGTLTPAVLKENLSAAKRRGIPVCVDPKSRAFEKYQPVTVITPNNNEAAEAAGIPADDEEALIEAGRKILSLLECEAVLVTRGEEGMTLFNKDESVMHIPAVAREVYDVTGAGDTVIATLALSLATGATLVEAAVLANHAAGVVVGKVGTATLTRHDLMAGIA